MEYSLLIKRIKKGLNPEEEKKFQQWYISSEDHRRYFQKCENSHKNNRSPELNSTLAWRKVKARINDNKNNYWQYSIAAILVLGLVSAPLYFFLNNPLGQENKVVNVQKIVKSPRDIIFRDHNGKSMSFGNNDSVIVAGQYYKANKNQLKIANIPGAIGSNTIIVPTGKLFRVELSDGTKVTLNAESKLIFPSSFAISDKREVILVYGEAYFEVASAFENQGKKFIVKNTQQDIEVVGTSFNIENYNQAKIVTTLVEGEINLLYGKREVALNPGQQSIINDHFLEGINEVNVNNYIAWKEGMFLFKDESLKDIFKVLSRWYGIEAKFQEEALEEMEFNGRFKKEQKLENILEIIENTKLARFELYGNKIKVMQYQE